MQQHDRQRAHKGVDKTTNLVLDGATTTYSDGAGLQLVLSDLDDRVAAGGGGGGGGGMADLITGDSQDFDGGNGDWVNSGGTLTSDAVNVMSDGGSSHSLKFVTDDVDQYIALDLPDLLADTDYVFIWWMSIAENDGVDRGFTANIDLWSRTFGVNTADGDPGNGAGQFVAYAFHYRPTSLVSGAQFKLSVANFTAHDITLNLGRFVMWQTAAIPIIALDLHTYAPILLNDPGQLRISLNNGNYGGIFLDPRGGVGFSNSTGQAGVQAYRDFGTVDQQVYLFAEHAPGDKVQEGIDIEVGGAYDGFFIGLKSEGTTMEDGRAVDGVVQFYADFGDYDFEFADGAVGQWRFRSNEDGYGVPSMGMLPRYASAPHSGTETEAESYYDTTLHKARTWDGSVWQNWW